MRACVRACVSYLRKRYKHTRVYGIESRRRLVARRSGEPAALAALALRMSTSCARGSSVSAATTLAGLLPFTFDPGFSACAPPKRWPPHQRWLGWHIQ